MSDSVTHIWITQVTEESKVLLISLDLWAHVFIAPAHPRLQKMVLPDILCCHFVHRHGKTILMTDSESSLPGSSTVSQAIDI